MTWNSLNMKHETLNMKFNPSPGLLPRRQKCLRSTRLDATKIAGVAPLNATKVPSSPLLTRWKCRCRTSERDENAGVAPLNATKMPASHLWTQRKCWRSPSERNENASVTRLNATEMPASHLWTRRKCQRRTSEREENAGVTPLDATKMPASHLWTWPQVFKCKINPKSITYEIIGYITWYSY